MKTSIRKEEEFRLLCGFFQSQTLLPALKDEAKKLALFLQSSNEEEHVFSLKKESYSINAQGEIRKLDAKEKIRAGGHKSSYKRKVYSLSKEGHSYRFKESLEAVLSYDDPDYVMEKYKLEDRNAVLKIEAHISQKITSPYVASSTLFKGRGEKYFELRAPYIKGQRYRELIQDVTFSRDEAKVIKFLRGVFEGLCHIHQAGVAHRDFVLFNILFENHLPVIVDFGSSACLDQLSPLDERGVTVLGRYWAQTFDDFLQRQEALASSKNLQKDLVRLGQYQDLYGLALMVKGLFFHTILEETFKGKKEALLKRLVYRLVQRFGEKRPSAEIALEEFDAICSL